MKYERENLCDVITGFKKPRGENLHIYCIKSYNCNCTFYELQRILYCPKIFYMILCYLLTILHRYDNVLLSHMLFALFGDLLFDIFHSGVNINVIYNLTFYDFINKVFKWFVDSYIHLGCFADGLERAIPACVVPTSRFWELIVSKCATDAMEYGYRVFAVQYSGLCCSGPDAHLRYNIYGEVTLFLFSPDHFN